MTNRWTIFTGDCRAWPGGPPTRRLGWPRASLCLSDVWAAVVWLEEDEQHRTWHGLYALCKAQGGEYWRAS